MATPLAATDICTMCRIQFAFRDVYTLRHACALQARPLRVKKGLPVTEPSLCTSACDANDAAQHTSATSCADSLYVRGDCVPDGVFAREAQHSGADAKLEAYLRP